MSGVNKTYSGPINTDIVGGPNGNVPQLGNPVGGQPGTFLIDSFSFFEPALEIDSGPDVEANVSSCCWIPDADGAGSDRVAVALNNYSDLYEFDVNDMTAYVRKVELNGIGNDVEGMFYNAATNELFTCSENAGGYTIGIFDWVKGNANSAVTAKQELTIAPAGADNNSGAEGICFRPDLGSNGVFYVVGEGYQSSTPRELFRVQRPANTTTDYDYNDAELIVDSLVDCENRFDGTGASFDFSDCELAPNNDLLIMSHTSNKIIQIDVEELFLNYNTIGVHEGLAVPIISEVILQDMQWEGVTFFGTSNHLLIVAESDFYSIAYAPLLPVINPLSDEVVTLGDTLTFTPTLSKGGDVFWSIVYAHDDVQIDPETGQVTWDTSGVPRGQAGWLGVRAYNSLGEDIVWKRVLISSDGSHQFHYCGYGEAATTLQQGLALMSSGDCLVMRDGTYPARPNDATLENGFLGGDGPSPGASGQMTTLMAETPLGVIIDGRLGYDTESSPNNVVMSLDGSAVMTEPELRDVENPSDPLNNYIKLAGFACGGVSYASFFIRRCHWFMAELCGSFDKDPTLIEPFDGGGTAARIQSCENVLIESCLDWGSNSRYHWQFKRCDKAIHRRSIARPDHYHGQDPRGGWAGYTCIRTISQDNIVIDGDHEFWTNNGNWAGMDSRPATGQQDVPHTNECVGLIGVNVDIPCSVIANDDGGTNQNTYLFHNCAFGKTRWAASAETAVWYAGIVHARGSASVNQITVAEAKRVGNVVVGDSAWLYSRADSFNAVNSILYRLGYDHDTETQYDPAYLTRWTSGTFVVSHCNIYPMPSLLSSGYSATIQNITSDIDPTTIGLKYLPRIESGSALQSSGQAGTRQGADCQYFHGKTWAFRDDPGWNTKTTTRRFPLQIEDLAYREFRKYSYTGTKQGGTGTLDGKRGACADNETFTGYIWGLLGNAVPVLQIAGKGKSGAALIYWEKPPKKHGQNVTAFKIYRDSVLIDTVSPNVFKYSDTVSPGTYSYKVKTVDSVLGESGDSYTETVTVV